MIIGLISDSHGNLELVHNAVVLLDRTGATRYVHLGDNYADVDQHIADGYMVERVPGIYASEYQRRTVPRQLTKTIDGVAFLFTHTEGDVTAADRGMADVICVGHTHIYEIRDEPACLVVNPGHLKGPVSKNRPPSCAVIETDSGFVTVKILGLDGTVIDEVRRGFGPSADRAVSDGREYVNEARRADRRKRKERRKAERRQKRDETALRKQAERRRRERRQRVRRRRDRTEPDLSTDEP